MTITGSGNRVPDYRREIDGLKDEIKKLWLTLGQEKAMPPVQKNMPFSWSGEMTGTKLSGPWVAEADLFITGCTMSQASGPSGTCTADLRVNGTTQHSFSLFSGQDRSWGTVRIAANIGDIIQLYVTSGGGSDLVAILSYITNGGW